MSEVDKRVEQLQLIEQNIQQLLVQKQSVQGQLVEVQSALEELGKSDEAFQIVGNVMVKKDPNSLIKQLTEKQEVLELRVQSVEKQEQRLREKAQAIQQEVMERMKDDDKR